MSTQALATARSLTLALLAPPAILIVWAHLLRPAAQGLDILAVLLSFGVGLAGLATSPWRLEVKMLVGVCYMGIALVAAPQLTLLAICSTGDCL